ncbi:MAG: prepilin-type N-terminal cleavage/methylation domain-containing protein [Phycisphaerae bacterium]|nr:prepilin-type N-terminal cleavage/methylation domain-containing protein [Phycisphaerae bacterium]
MARDRHGDWRGFTLIELLVVVAIVVLLVSILVPTLSKARIKAKVVKVHAELHGIGRALEMYADDQREYPLAQSFCAGESQNMDQYYELPAELFREHYLTGRMQGDGKHEYVWYKDPFDPDGNSLKYMKTGVGWGNNHQLTSYRIWVPKDFPNDDCNDVNDVCYPTYKLNPAPDPRPWERWVVDEHSPVAYAIWSCGPGGKIDWLAFQESQIADDPNRSHLPVPSRNWYPNEGAGGESIVCHVMTSKYFHQGAGHRFTSQ